MDGRSIWDAAQILVAIACFFAGCWHRRQRLEPTNFLEGNGYFEETHFSADRQSVFETEPTVVIGRAGVPLKAPIAFRLVERAGAAVTSTERAEPGRLRDVLEAHCVDSTLLDVIAEAPAASKALYAVLASGVIELSADGDTLWVTRRSSDFVDAGVLVPLFELRDALEPIAARVKTSPSRTRVKIIVLWGFVWFFMSFAITNLLELIVDDGNVAVDPTQLIVKGFITGLGSLIAFVIAIGIAFRGTLDFKGTVDISMGLLLIGIPVGALKLASDANRYLDRSSAITITKEVKRIRRHSSRSIRFDGYEIMISPDATDAMKLPSRLVVSAFTSIPAGEPLSVDLQIGSGWLDVPWYRHIAVRPR